MNEKPPNPPVNPYFEKMVKDTFGDDAVVGTGMMLVSGDRQVEHEGATFVKHIVAGVVLATTDFNPNDPDWQRWDCDVILVPRRKLADNKIYKGGTVDTYLTGGLQHTESWAKQIFPEEKPIEDVIDEAEQARKTKQR